LISIIIPTRNRATILENCLSHLQPLVKEVKAEVVVVDNNSTDGTGEVGGKVDSDIKTVKEPRTSFSRARQTGREGACGEVLLFIDDDSFVKAGSLQAIEEIFRRIPWCGVIAGQIEPEFEEQPPEWVKQCQSDFNGFSVLNGNYYPKLASGEQETDSACGPMLAIRADLYDRVGGFPPDTIGVETDHSTKTFRKLYVGPGDYGLCHKIRSAGYKVIFSPKVACIHWIPKIRNTVGFWRSRVLGEGHHQALTDRKFFNKTPKELAEIKNTNFENLKKKRNCLKKTLGKKRKTNLIFESPILPGELSYLQTIGYLEMSKLIDRNTGLDDRLWDLATRGILDHEAALILQELPNSLFHILDSRRYYSDTPMTMQQICGRTWEKFVARQPWYITCFEKLFFK